MPSQQYQSYLRHSSILYHTKSVSARRAIVSLYRHDGIASAEVLSSQHKRQDNIPVILELDCV